MLAIREAAFPKNNPSVIQALRGLASCRTLQGHVDEALPLYARILIASEEHLRQQRFSFSERAETLVTSLRKVNDETTCELMEA